MYIECLDNRAQSAKNQRRLTSPASHVFTWKHLRLPSTNKERASAAGTETNQRQPKNSSLTRAESSSKPTLYSDDEVQMKFKESNEVYFGQREHRTKSLQPRRGFKSPQEGQPLLRLAQLSSQCSDNRQLLRRTTAASPITPIVSMHNSVSTCVQQNLKQSEKQAFRFEAIVVEDYLLPTGNDVKKKANRDQILSSSSRNQSNRKTHYDSARLPIQTSKKPAIQEGEGEESSTNQVNSNTQKIATASTKVQQDPLQLFDELKQIYLAEQKNISSIISKGLTVLDQREGGDGSGSGIAHHTKGIQQVNSTTNHHQDSSHKEGLLGAYKDYQRMSKEDIIEKLLVSEHIMKTLYRKNKMLEEKLHKINSSTTANVE